MAIRGPTKAGHFGPGALPAGGDGLRPVLADSGGSGRDCRWLVLLLAAIVCAGAGTAGHFLAHRAEPAGCDLSSAAPRGAGELCWRDRGPAGPGIYLAVSANNDASSAAGRVSDDPRLAVFTFRSIDLNRADAGVLQSLKGIGPKLAAAIVRDRESHGPYHRLEDLTRISGVGPATIARLRGQAIAGN